jgi:hypothetical protein
MSNDASKMTTWQCKACQGKWVMPYEDSYWRCPLCNSNGVAEVGMKDQSAQSQTTVFSISADRLWGEWHPIDTVPEGEPVLLFWPHGERGGWGGIETAVVFKDQNSPTGLNYWTHGSANGGSDWEPRNNERPTHWMRAPAGPVERKAATKKATGGDT